MKRTGSFQSAARLSDSWNSPSGTAPSPKKQSTTWSPPWYVMAKPAPAASGRGGPRDAGPPGGGGGGRTDGGDARPPAPHSASTHAQDENQGRLPVYGAVALAEGHEGK